MRPLSFDNQIGDEGAEALIIALNYNVSIKELNMWGINQSPEVWATIKYLTETRNKILIHAAVRRAGDFPEGNCQNDCNGSLENSQRSQVARSTH